VTGKQQAVIVSAVRTPMGSFNGVFSPVPATKLGSLTIADALKWVHLPPERVDEVYIWAAFLAPVCTPWTQEGRGAGWPASALGAVKHWR